MAEKYSIEQKTVENILGIIRNGEVAIPEIQRPFVWKGSQVRDLIDSLYNGYPAGYLIVWQNPNVKLKDGSTSAGKKILIDGQQRVTAMMTAIDGREVLLDDYSSKQIKIAFNPWAAEGEPTFEVQTAVHLKDKKWIPDISLLFKPGFDDFEFIEAYVATNPDIERKEINRKIKALQQIVHRQLGVIMLDAALGIDEVTEIFVRINSQGKVLNEADFAMSKIAADSKFGGNILRKAIDYFCHLAVKPSFYANVSKDAEFMETDYANEMKWLKDDYKEIYDPDYSDMLRVSLMHKFGRGKLKDLVSLLSGRDFTDRTFKESIMKDSFEKLSAGVHNFISEYNTKQFVQAIESAGFVSPKLLRAQMPLDFAYTLYLLLKDNCEAWGVKKIEIKNVVRKWFVFSVLTGRYSSSPESKMDRDIRGIFEKGFIPYFDSIQAAELGDAFWNVSLVQMLETNSNAHPSFNVFLAAQVFFNDKSLLSSTPVAYLIDNGDIHHIFPKDYLRKGGFTKSQYNQIANYTYLETPVNISIGNSAPNEYFVKAFDQCKGGGASVGTILETSQLLENLQMNCVPEDIVNMSISDYETVFLPARRKLMAAKIQKYYESL